MKIRQGKVLGKALPRNNARYFSQEKSSNELPRGFSEQYMKLARRMKVKLFEDKCSAKTMKHLKPLKTYQIKIPKKMNEKNQTFTSFIPITESHPSIRLKSHRKHGKKFLRKSHYSLFNDDKPLFLKNKPLEPQSQLFLDPNNIQEINGFIECVEKANTIRKAINMGVAKQRYILEGIKAYVLEKGKKGHNNYDKIMLYKEEQQQMRELITLERCFMIAMVDIIGHEGLSKMIEECRMFLTRLFEFYFCVVQEVGKMQAITPKIKSKVRVLAKQLQQSAIRKKNNLTSTILYLNTCIHGLFRFNRQYFTTVVRNIIHQSSSSTINRCFYNLLEGYALYLANHDDILHNKPEIANFATCPSPYILQPRKDRSYTLVVDLDETLIHTVFDEGQYRIQYRPHVFEFLHQVAQVYEIVVFTSSLLSYATQVVQNLKFITHVLCRHHTIRTKSEYIKDISRIGRPLESMLIVDNLPDNFRLQPKNGIHICSWFGEEDDEQLPKLSKMLVSIAEQKPADLRDAMESYEKIQ